MSIRSSLTTLLIAATAITACDDETTPPEQEGPIFAFKAPFAAPSDPLADDTVTSCAIFQEQQCDGGQLFECSVYDTADDAFVAADDLTHRALMVERWYDLYHSPAGLSAARVAKVQPPGDTPEEEWSALDNFSHYSSVGDAAIWTGTALNAHILRYVNTGTEADYLRMEEKVRSILTLFDVTRIPGYLARNHYIDFVTGAPNTDEVIATYDNVLSHRDHVMEDPATIANLPALYFDGLTDDSGTVWQGVPYWHGSPSIDQYSGMTTTLPAAWRLLRDESLKQRISDHMTCYLKRLDRVELINIQSDPSVAASFADLLSRNVSNTEPGDVDITALDRMVFYVLRQPNSLNVDAFDPTCPDTITMQPTTVIDMASNDFELPLLGFLLDLNGKWDERRTGIDHYYVPTARGYDAIHLMNLALMAYQFTGDEMYRSFLEDELIDNLDAVAGAHIFSAVLQPKWCRKWYGSHIAIAPLWGFLNQLDDSWLKSEVQKVMYEEAWLKDAVDQANIKFALMFAGTVPEEVGSGQAEAFAWALENLRTFGGNDGVLESPRRAYHRTFEELEPQLPADIEMVCPSEEMVSNCEEPIVFLGFEVEGADITKACTGAAGECVMQSGECAPALASKALPPMLRRFGAFQWQRSPFALATPDLRDQSDGVDIIEPYWLARQYGLLPEADNQVLAWRDVGSCTP